MIKTARQLKDLIRNLSKDKSADAQILMRNYMMERFLERISLSEYTPEMNPIEQIWKEIRKRGFRNEVFATLEKVVDRLCDTICSLHNNVISSITGRDWIIEVFN